MNYVFCLANDIDIVCVVESWLSPDISDIEICIPGFEIFRRNRNRHGGGILIFVFCTTVSFQYANPSVEFLPLCIEFCNHKFCISTFFFL